MVLIQTNKYKVCGEDSCTDITQDEINRLQNPKANNANVDSDYKNVDGDCTSIKSGGLPFCYFKNSSGGIDSDYAQKYQNLNPASYSYRDNIKCSTANNTTATYGNVTHIFREITGTDDIYRLCQRNVSQDNDDCCLNNNLNTGDKCPDGKSYQSGTCNNIISSKITNEWNMNDTRNDTINWTDTNGIYNKYTNANKDAARAFADSKCLDYKGMTNYNNCQGFYDFIDGKHNTYFEDRAKDYCTDNSRLFNANNQCLKQGSNFVNTPTVVQDYINKKRIDFCKSNPSNSNCTDRIKDYNTYGDSLISYCKGSDGKYTNVGTTEPCNTFYNIDTSATTLSVPSGYNLNNADQITRIRNDKINYCNDSGRFKNARCSPLVQTKPEYFDLLTSQNCTDYSVEPCKTYSNPISNKMPINALKQVNNCIDANNMLKASDANCVTLAKDRNSPYRMNLLEPSINYCKTGNNATNDAFCQSILPNQVGVLSGFVGNKEETIYDELFNILFLLMLICVVIAVTYKYKDQIINHDLFTCYK